MWAEFPTHYKVKDRCLTTVTSVWKSCIFVSCVGGFSDNTHLLCVGIWKASATEKHPAIGFPSQMPRKALGTCPLGLLAVYNESWFAKPRIHCIHLLMGRERSQGNPVTGVRSPPGHLIFSARTLWPSPQRATTQYFCFLMHFFTFSSDKNFFEKGF